MPNTPARELFLPVNQISASLQLRPGLSVEVYDQLEWRQDRLPGVGSYFSTADFLDAGGERIIVAPGRFLYRVTDRQPGASGQFGAALRATVGDIDLGLYALRYNARQPFVTPLPCPVICNLPGQTGAYRLTYVRGISVLGASASTLLGDDNVAGEISWRHAAPLFTAEGFGPSGPRGDTAQGQISIVAERPANWLWDRATVAAELAANTVVATAAGRALHGVTGGAAAVEGQITLDYFHVRPGLDLSPFIALSYGLIGRSSVDPEMVANAGNVTVGIQATYRTVWHLELSVTDYIGSAGRQSLADRSFAAFNLRRSF